MLRIVPTAQAKLRRVCNNCTEDEAEGTVISVSPEFLPADLAYADSNARRRSKTRRITEFGTAGVNTPCTLREMQYSGLNNCEATSPDSSLFFDLHQS